MPEDFLASPPKETLKLPFKPTAIGRAARRKRKPRGDDDDSDSDGLSLFRRSKVMAPIVAADLERRHKRRQRQREREQEQEEKKRQAAAAREELERVEEAQQINDEAGVDSGTLEGQHLPTTQRDDDRASELVTPPPSKRSRTDTASSHKPNESNEEADENAVASPSPSARRFIQNYRAPESPPPASSSKRSPVRRSPRKQAQAPKEQPGKQSFNPTQAAVISLLTDSDEDAKPATVKAEGHRDSSSDVEITRVSPRRPAPEEAPAAEPEEDEFAEYVQRAQEQRARNEALLRSTSDGSLAKESTTIIVRSEIPGTKTLGVKALYNQPLRLFRDSWLAVQRRDGVEIPTEHPDDVVITWRRRRVYNNSTLQMMGIRPAGDGRFAVDGRPTSTSLRRSGFDESHSRVCLEVWTPELFAEMEREEDLRRRRDVGELGYDEDEHGRTVEDEEPAAAAPSPKIKVVLKARGHDDVGLSVRAETTVETLITGYRTKRGLSAAKDVSVWFDGERLEEHMTMDECEIVDMDTIEVHIK